MCEGHASKLRLQSPATRPALSALTEMSHELGVSLTSSMLASWVNDNFHLKIGQAESVNISFKPAQRWLNILGLRFGKVMKRSYHDHSHERDDVVKYRNAFIELIAVYETRMM